MTDFASKREKSRIFQSAINQSIWLQWSSHLQRYVQRILEKSPILVWLQEPLALVNPTFLNDIAVLRAQKKSNTTTNDYSITRN
jgi:hypothetical protein